MNWIMFLMLGLLAYTVYAGWVSLEANVLLPYFQCLGSASMLLTLLPSTRPTWSDGEAIIDSIAIAIGAYLAYASIRDGHWSTRLLGAIVAIPYVMIFSTVPSYACNNWSQIVRYWLH